MWLNFRQLELICIVLSQGLFIPWKVVFFKKNYTPKKCVKPVIVLLLKCRHFSGNSSIIEYESKLLRCKVVYFSSPSYFIDSKMKSRENKINKQKLV